MIEELAERAGIAMRAEGARVAASLERPVWLGDDTTSTEIIGLSRVAVGRRRNRLAVQDWSYGAFDLDGPDIAQRGNRLRRRILASAAIVLVVGVIVFASIASRSERAVNTDKDSNQRTTLLELHHGDPVLQPTRTLLSLDGYLTDRFAVGPDGTIVIATDPARSTNNTISLQVLEPDGTTRDIGITVPADALFAFGPAGDLYTRSTFNPPQGLSTFNIIRIHPQPTGHWQQVMRATGGYPDACGLVVTPVVVGCGPGGGVSFDPPIEFDRVTADPAIAAIQRLGGSVRNSWFTKVQLDQDAACSNPNCDTMFAPGPDRSAVWFPDIYDAPYTHAVFVLDDRPIAGAAWLSPDISYVAGVAGTDLLAVQTTNGTSALVAIDLTPITHQQ